MFRIARVLQHISKCDASADMLFLPSSSSVTLLLHTIHLISAAVLALAGIACWSLITACQVWLHSLQTACNLDVHFGLSDLSWLECRTRVTR